VIQSEDVVVALSNSGETDELLQLLETIRRLGAKLIAITGSRGSTLGQAADVALDCSVAEEACPMNLVPTASTTAALAIGDALAMTLMVEKGFREEDFANLHPGGKLGKRLMRVEALMHAGEDCPVVHHDTPMPRVFYEMSRKGLGMTCVVDADERLLGIITDGDLRRRMERGAEIQGLMAADVMTSHPVTIGRATLAAEALNVMEQRKITAIVVIEDGAANTVAGVLHIHDLWRMEMF
jgi:arabinose-5-phosphate isomerase